jgi:hypothetical protein
MLEIVNWDLSRDSKAADNADIIIDIYNTLTVMSEDPTNDDRASISDIRRLQVLRASLNDAATSTTDRIDSNVGNDSDDSGPVFTGSGSVIPNNALVYYGDSEYTVLGRDGGGLYGLKQPVYPYNAVSGIPRNQIAVKAGCSRFACVGKKVYYGEIETMVVAIYPSGNVTMKQAVYPYNVHSNILPSKIGKTEGCISDSYSRQICAGTRAVYGTSDVSIVAVFTDGTVTLKQPVYPYNVFGKIDPKALILR